jgi:hypothetical protein
MEPQLQSFVPFVRKWNDSSPTSFAVVAGVLPPAVSGFFSFFMPIIVRWLSHYQGSLTQSRLDRAVVGRYFAFLVLSQLIVFTLIGVIFSEYNLFSPRPSLFARGVADAVLCHRLDQELDHRGE